VLRRLACCDASCADTPHMLQGLGRGTALDPAAPILSSIAKAVVPVFLRDGLYDYIAKNRHVWFGESNECRLWDDRFDERFVGDLEP